VAAGANILLNLFFIRRYGALAASVNTVVCYVIYIVSLAVVEFRRRRIPLAE
jgi:O-antigen/teichoic acid export membrane protein